jgi:hypothetical protein
MHGGFGTVVLKPTVGFFCRLAGKILRPIEVNPDRTFVIIIVAIAAMPPIISPLLIIVIVIIVSTRYQPA